MKVTTRTTNSTITITTPAFQTTVEYCKYNRRETATSPNQMIELSEECAVCAHHTHMLCYFIAWNEYTHNFPHIFQFGQNKFIDFTIHILYKEHSGNQFHEWTTKTNTKKKQQVRVIHEKQNKDSTNGFRFGCEVLCLYKTKRNYIIL